MKQTLIMLIILIALILSGCQNVPNNVNTNSDQPAQNIVQTQELSCDGLMQKLDTTKITFDDCKNIWKSNSTIKNMVGGILLNINKTYEDGYDQYWYTLTFQGKNAQKEIHIIAKNESQFNERNLQIGKFYEFDMSGICIYIMSSANSGALAGTFTEKDCN